MVCLILREDGGGGGGGVCNGDSCAYFKHLSNALEFEQETGSYPDCAGTGTSFFFFFFFLFFFYVCNGQR